MKIGLLGFGTIGQGVYQQCADIDGLEVTRVLDLRELPELADKLTRNFDDIVNDPAIDTVVELIGGLHPAREFVLRALESGKNVVTANKYMLSFCFEELMCAARDHGVQLRVDASVGGGIPYLYNLMRTMQADEITAFSGIVNGTTNLILDVMQTSDADFADVLKQAQAAGYAEANPSADIDGIDARSKLCVTGSIVFGKAFNPETVDTMGIRSITSEDVKQFKALGRVCRLIASAKKTENGFEATVEPTLFLPNASEACVTLNNNLIGFEGKYLGHQHFYGQGAGRNPTAVSVVLGLVEILRGTCPALPHPQGTAVIDNASSLRRYYIRTSQPLALPAETLGEGMYLTAPVSPAQVHARKATDPDLFFASLQ